MDNYEDLTDEEINKAVQHIRQGKQLWAPLLDYCNNPSDAWPIIETNGISLIVDDGAEHWSACRYSGGGLPNLLIEVFNKNPLRAAMIVFLKMQEAPQ